MKWKVISWWLRLMEKKLGTLYVRLLLLLLLLQPVVTAPCR